MIYNVDSCIFCEPENKLKGLVVWVTGASSGIGEELAHQLAKCGSRLILSARREDELKRVKRCCLGKKKRKKTIDIFIEWLSERKADLKFTNTLSNCCYTNTVTL